MTKINKIILQIFAIWAAVSFSIKAIKTHRKLSRIAPISDRGLYIAIGCLLVVSTWAIGVITGNVS